MTVRSVEEIDALEALLRAQLKRLAVERRVAVAIEKERRAVEAYEKATGKKSPEVGPPGPK